MCAFITPPFTARVLPRALIGITCSCIIIARARRRESKAAGYTAPSRAMGDDVKRIQIAGRGMAEAVMARATSATAASGQFQALASFAKLFTSVRVFGLLQSSLQSMWLMVATGAAVLKAWTESLPKPQFAEAYHAPKAAVQVDTVRSFCGTWVKDTKCSDSMDEFCDLFGVPRFMRQATRLMGGLELVVKEDSLMVKQVCKVGFLSATESYPLDGIHSNVHKRRDLRSGKQFGKLLYAAEDQMQLKVVFEGPLPGEAVDTLQLQEDGNTLIVQHRAALVGKGSAHFKEVFKRAKNSS